MPSPKNQELDEIILKYSDSKGVVVGTEQALQALEAEAAADRATVQDLKAGNAAVATARRAFERVRNQLWKVIQQHIEKKPFKELGRLGNQIDVRRDVLTKVLRHIEKNEMIEEYAQCLREGIDGNFLAFIDVVVRSRAIDTAWSHPSQLGTKKRRRKDVPASPEPARYVFVVEESLELRANDGGKPLERTLPVNECFVDAFTYQEWLQVIRCLERHANRPEDVKAFVLFFIYGHSWSEVAQELGASPLVADRYRLRVERLVEAAAPDLREAASLSMFQRLRAFW